MFIGAHDNFSFLFFRCALQTERQKSGVLTTYHLIISNASTFIYLFISNKRNPTHTFLFSIGSQDQGS